MAHGRCRMEAVIKELVALVHNSFVFQISKHECYVCCAAVDMHSVISLRSANGIWSSLLRL